MTLSARILSARIHELARQVRAVAVVLHVADEPLAGLRPAVSDLSRAVAALERVYEARWVEERDDRR